MEPKKVILSSVLISLLLASAVSCAGKAPTEFCSSSGSESAEVAFSESDALVDSSDEDKTEVSDPIRNPGTEPIAMTEPTEGTDNDTTHSKTEASGTVSEAAPDTDENPTEADTVILPKDWF